MKIVSLLLAKLFAYIILPYALCSEIGIGSLKKLRTHHKSLNEHTQAPAQSNTPAKKELPDVPIYYQGWIKYLHYTDKDNQKPKAFYKNTEFANQSKRGIEGAELKKKENGVFVNIPNELNFYSTLYKDTLNIFHSRKVRTNLINLGWIFKHCRLD